MLRSVSSLTPAERRYILAKRRLLFARDAEIVALGDADLADVGLLMYDDERLVPLAVFAQAVSGEMPGALAAEPQGTAMPKQVVIRRGNLLSEARAGLEQVVEFCPKQVAPPTQQA